MKCVFLQDNKVHIHNLSGDTLTETKCLDQTGAVTDVKYSPDGQYLVTSDAGRKIYLYQMPNYEVRKSIFLS